MALSKHHEYDPISPSSLDEKDTGVPYSDHNSEDEPFLESRQPMRSSRLSTGLPWILCAVFAITSVVLASLLFLQTGRIGIGYINEFRKHTKHTYPCCRKLTFLSSRSCNNSP
jgi:hypothetical protein